MLEKFIDFINHHPAVIASVYSLHLIIINIIKGILAVYKFLKTKIKLQIKKI